MNPYLGITLAAICLGVFVQVINKFLINEKMVDQKKEEMKELQKNMKGLDPKGKEFGQMQERVLDINMVIMKQQFKPLIITFIPYIIAFQILAGAYAFAPIAIDSHVSVTMLGNGNVYADCLDLNKTVVKKEVVDAVVSKDSCNFILNGRAFNNTIVGKDKAINFEATDMTMEIKPPKQVFINLPFSIPMIGDKIGWLGTFIMISFIITTVLQRALKGIYFRKWE